MNWLRWYHGTVSDPKWRVIAKKTGQPVAVVIAVWAALMENASESQDRGTLHNWSDEVVGTMLDIDDETVKRICNAMKQSETKVLVSDHLAAWEKRNPKREREDNSTERVQQFRDRKRHETPRNATKRPEQNREEKNIEEGEETLPSASADKLAPKYSTGFETFWSHSTKRGSKVDASREWGKLKPTTELSSTINAAMQAWKATDQWQDETKQPHLFRWLRRRGWEEHIPQTSGSNGNGQHKESYAERVTRRNREITLEVDQQLSGATGDGSGDGSDKRAAGALLPGIERHR